MKKKQKHMLNLKRISKRILEKNNKKIKTDIKVDIRKMEINMEKKILKNKL